MSDAAKRQRPESEPSNASPPAGEAPPGGDGADQAPAPPPATVPPPPSPQEYQEALQKAGERDLYRDELLRSRADFDNYQKRMRREKTQAQEQAVRRLVADLLPVLDNFDRALGGEEATVESIKSGIRIVRDMLQKAFRDHGVEEIDPLGQPFDPLLHDAVVQEESTAHPPNTVSEVLEKGYLHRGSVVRAAKVKVARAPEEAASPRPHRAGERPEG